MLLSSIRDSTRLTYIKCYDKSSDSSSAVSLFRQNLARQSDRVKRMTSWVRKDAGFRMGGVGGNRKKKKQKKKPGILGKTEEREAVGRGGGRRRTTPRTYPCLRSSPRHFPPLL